MVRRSAITPYLEHTLKGAGLRCCHPGVRCAPLREESSRVGPQLRQQTRQDECASIGSNTTAVLAHSSKHRMHVQPIGRPNRPHYLDRVACLNAPVRRVPLPPGRQHRAEGRGTCPRRQWGWRRARRAEPLKAVPAEAHIALDMPAMQPTPRHEKGSNNKDWRRVAARRRHDACMATGCSGACLALVEQTCRLRGHAALMVQLVGNAFSQP